MKNEVAVKSVNYVEYESPYGLVQLDTNIVKNRKIIKTLVRNRIRRRQRKNTSTWNILREQCGRISD